MEEHTQKWDRDTDADVDDKNIVQECWEQGESKEEKQILVLKVAFWKAKRVEKEVQKDCKGVRTRNKSNWNIQGGRRETCW